MNCPVCAVELRLSERHGVEIDHCPRCRGVWLDRGELDKILERGGPVGDRRRPEESRGSQRPSYDDDDDYDDDSRYPKRKRKGFLRELFDFD